MTELKSQLRALGLTQRAFARLLGVTERVVGAWSRGEKATPRYALVAIALLSALPDDKRQAFVALWTADPPSK